MFMSIKNNLKSAMDGFEGGISQYRLAEISKVPQPTIQRILKGSSPQIETLRKLADALGKPLIQLIDGDEGSQELSAGPEIRGRVPLISSVRAGQWSDAEDIYDLGDGEEMRLTTAKVGKSAFALRIEGDSMTAPYGQSIPEGMIVIVDPGVRPENGSIVIAKLEDDNKATIKKLSIDGSKRYLMPLNPRYEPQVINGNCRIIGVVVKGEVEF